MNFSPGLQSFDIAPRTNSREQVGQVCSGNKKMREFGWLLKCFEKSVLCLKCKSFSWMNNGDNGLGLIWLARKVMDQRLDGVDTKSTLISDDLEVGVFGGFSFENGCRACQRGIETYVLVLRDNNSRHTVSLPVSNREAKAGA